MSASLQKLFKENSVGMLVTILLIAYGVYLLYTNLSMKGSSGAERMTAEPNPAYVNGNGAVQPAMPQGQNEVYSSVTDIKTSSYGLPPSCSRGTISDPADLLPKDTNSQWAQLNPAGSADFKNVNLLKAGYNIGIDTVGSSLRNANLQVRSEPPNPTTIVSPWLNTTIEPDLMRAPLEIGCGPQ